MKKFNFLFAMLFMAAAIISCSKDNSLSGSKGPKEPAPIMPVGTECLGQTCPLNAGQTLNWGTLSVTNDLTNLYVSYTAAEGKSFGTLHLWVGTSLDLLEFNNGGNIAIGQFPYSFDASGVTTHTFTVPFNNIPVFASCNTPISIVAHAEMSDGTTGQTAFGGCTPHNVQDVEVKGRWYYTIEYAPCCYNQPSARLGTAFAKGGYVFTTNPKSNPEKLPSLKLIQNRWGWAINMPAAGEYTSDIYVGAGLNNTTTATKVGTATIVWDGSNATISYDLVSPFSLEEVHIFANDLKPLTTAPGQYGFTQYFDPKQEDLSNVILPVSDSDGDGAWFILHAIVWGPAVVAAI